MELEKLLIGIVAALFQTISSTFIILKLSKIRKNIPLFFILMFIYTIFAICLIPNELRFGLYIIVATILSYFILKIKSKLALLISFISITIFVVSEIIISIFLVIVGIDSVKIIEDIFMNLLANILIALLSIFISCIPFIFNKLLKLNNLYIKNKMIRIYFYLILMILYLISLKNGFEFLLKSNYYVNILFMLGIVLILTFITKSELKSEQLKDEYQQMLNYVSKYEKIITEQGKANHEFKNQLMVIKGYAKMNPLKLIEYIDSITEDTKKTESSYIISQLNKFPDGGIKGLLYYKLSTMSEEKIKYNLHVEPGIKLKLSKLSVIMNKDLTKILGVLLDNAIDASKKSKLKNIIILVEKDNNSVIFSIQNSYKGKIEISKLGTGYTTKGNKHGYGLKLVKDILKNNSVFTIENTYDKEYFYTKLIIKLKQNKKKK